MSEQKIVVDVSNLSFSYKKHRALKSISFSVLDRSIHGFIGPNGAGKTTTLNILSTLLKPEFGHAEIFGYDVVQDYKEVRKRIGFMPDHFSTYQQMTVFEYLDFFAAAYGLTIEGRNTTIKDVLALTDMSQFSDEYIHTLSRGMQQRISLARLLVHDPELLLLDEPASGLDPRARMELMEILKELRQLGKTIFISSHILSELADLCDSVTILDRGIIRFTGELKSLLNQQSSRRSYILVLDEENHQTEEILKKLEGITNLAIEADNTRYKLEVDVECLTPNQVLENVIKSGGQITSFVEDVQHLNKAFMMLTTPGVAR